MSFSRSVEPVSAEALKHFLVNLDKMSAYNVTSSFIFQFCHQPIHSAQCPAFGKAILSPSNCSILASFPFLEFLLHHLNPSTVLLSVVHVVTVSISN